MLLTPKQHTHAYLITNLTNLPTCVDAPSVVPSVLLLRITMVWALDPCAVPVALQI